MFPSIAGGKSTIRDVHHLGPARLPGVLRGRRGDRFRLRARAAGLRQRILPRGQRLPWYAIGFSIIAAGISSEQFVGEMGYAYKLGMPVVNWEWLVFPALSILLWIFVPLYVRNRITTMPEYLEQRFGGQARTLYAWLTVASYVFVNFALVFYTGGFALEAMWGIDGWPRSGSWRWSRGCTRSTAG